MIETVETLLEFQVLFFEMIYLPSSEELMLHKLSFPKLLNLAKKNVEINTTK